jgi:hypothetical protein
MEKSNKREPKLRDIIVGGIVGGALVLGSFGSVLGLESNLMRFDNFRIQDTSFRAYLDQGKEQFGENARTYAFALWTYPGARLGVEIHNYGLPEN